MHWLALGFVIVIVLIIIIRSPAKQAWQHYQQKRRITRQSSQARQQREFAPPLFTLVSPVGGSYFQLRDLLAAQQYREADQETYRMLLWGARREKEGWLRHHDIDEFPSTDLLIIDRLWREYSDNRFGFSVQKAIYQELGGTKEYNERIWLTFGEQVGWRRRDNWLSYSQLIFQAQAPTGHLPAAGGVWVGVVPHVVGWGSARYFLARPDL